MLCGRKFWQGEGLSNMPTFRIRMALAALATIDDKHIATRRIFCSLNAKYLLGAKVT
jgi:hypothetical protein